MRWLKFAKLAMVVLIGVSLAILSPNLQADTIGPFTFHNSNVVMQIWGDLSVLKGEVRAGDVLGAFVDSVTVNDGCIGAYQLQAIDITSDTEAFYGFLPAYGDDTGTPEKDGAAENDVVTFKYYSTMYDNVFLVDGTHTTTFAGGTILPSPGLEIPDIMLPVELSAFSAAFNRETSQILLKWRTESEINNLGFDVYRSETPDEKFVKINPAHIKGAGTDSTTHDYKFIDESAVVGKTYYYYIESISFSGEREKSRTIKIIIDASGKARVTSLMRPTASALLQNFPNPFNPETWIPFHLAKDADVTLRIFDIRGKEIRTIHLGQRSAGYYDSKAKAVLWDGRDSYGQEVCSGIYFYNIAAGTFNSTRKLTIIK